MRWRRGLLVALALLPPALLAGVVTARVDHPFGPHEAVYEVTADSQVTVSLGPLGALVMPTPLPGPLGYLGARVEVGPIPADLAAAALGEAAAAPSAAELAGDLEQYGQAYLGIGTTVRHAAGRLALDAAVRAGLWWGGSVAALALALAAAGRARRNQVGFWLGRRRLLAWGLAGAVALCGAGAAWAAAAAQRPASWPAGDPLLAGTPLAGAHLTGRLGQLASLYGRVALNAYQQSSAFYSRAADSVEAAFADQAAQAEARAADAAQASPSPGPGSGSGSGESPGPGAGESPGPGPGGSPLPGAGPGESPSPGAGESSGPGGGEGSGAGESPGPTSGESPGAGAGQSPSASPTPPWLDGPGPYGGLTPVLFFSDLHCNVGMAGVVGAAARASGAALVLDGGDTTMDGTSVERYCVDVVADALPEGVPWVVAGGNHDTGATLRQEAEAGAVVLDGSVAQVAGLSILGDRDPTHTEVAQGTALVGDETVAQAGQRLGRAACQASRPVDLLVVHQPAMAAEAMAAGCLPAAVTGHMHTRTNPHVVGQGVLYTQSSTGRDTRDSTTLGPLAAPAELTVMLFDQDNRWVAWQLLTVYPDAGAKLSAIKAVPEPPAAQG